MRVTALLVISATLLCLGAGSAAAGHTSPYFAVGLGLTRTADSDFTFTTPPSVSSTSFENGYFISGALGVDYAYQDGWPRFELEFAHRIADLDAATIGGSGYQAGGSLTVTTAMANIILDMPVFRSVTPYVMAGGGYAWVGLEDYTIAGSPAASKDRIEDTVAAGQAGLGLGIHLGGLTTLDLGYRYLFAEDPEFEDGSTIELASHAALLALRIKLY